MTEINTFIDFMPTQPSCVRKERKKEKRKNRKRKKEKKITLKASNNALLCLGVQPHIYG